MRTRNFLKSSASALAAAAMLLISAPACSQVRDSAAGEEEAAAPAVPADQESVNTSVQADVMDNAKGDIDQKRSEVINDAVQALEHTEKALEALAKKDSKAALDALALATGKLDLVLAREPGLALAPIDVTVVTEDLIGTVEAIRALRKDIRELVDDKKFQQARPLMQAFGSEIVIRTESLPLATYPDAIKAAAKLIDEGKPDAARIALNAALGTIVITDRVVPLPLTRAQAMLDEAEAILDKKKKVEGDAQARLKSLQENAAYQVELAKAFGYGDRTLYKTLQDDIEDLKNRLNGGKSQTGLFGKIRNQIDELTADSQNDKSDSAESGTDS